MIVNSVEELCKVVTFQGFNEILEKHDALEKALNGAQTWRRSRPYMLVGN